MALCRVVPLMNTKTTTVGFVLAMLAACGGDDDSASPDAALAPDAANAIDAGVEQHSVQVTVSGLRGDLGVVLNGGAEQILSADGSLVLGSLDVAASYSVTIGSQPGISDCVVEAGSGTIASEDLDIAITCDLLMFMTMTDGVNGMEWWKSDGTDAGTVMVSNIGPGDADGSFDPKYGLLPRDYIVFSAHNGVDGTQLFKSDGTDAGTTMVKKINPTNSADPHNFIEFGDAVYFVASNGVDGDELWKTDGTDAGTSMVKNINGTAANSLNLQYAVVMDGALYFAASTEAEGVELWKSDGTESGTVMVKDIDQDGTGSSPSYLVVMGDTLYFAADGGTATGRELWKSDGTESGTVMVKDINPDGFDSFPGELIVVGNALYLSADSPGTNGGLWKSDGTTEGTIEVRSGADGGPINWGEALEFEGNLYFSAASLVDGLELWRTDGTADGTFQVKDIKLAGGSPREAQPYSLSPVPGGFVFSAYNDALGRELWKSDGTEEGTVALEDINVDGSSFAFSWGDGPVLFRDFALYFADDGSSGMDPYRVDMTGATKVKEVNLTGSALPKG